MVVKDAPCKAFKLPQQVKMIAAKSDDLSSIPRIHIVEEEFDPLLCPHVPSSLATK